MKPFSVLLLLLLFMSVRAQQIIVPDTKLRPVPFTMFWNSKSLFNPAASGIDNKYYAALTGREQWMGIKNAPRNLGVIMSMKSDFLHGAVGLNYVYTGSQEMFKIHNPNANYSYHINLGSERILSAGISAGLTMLSSDYTMFDFPFYHEKSTYTYYSFHLGSFYSSNHLQLGLSSGFFEHTDINSGGKVLSNNIYVYSSYRFDIGKILDINPELLISKHNAYTENIILSTGLLFTFKDRFRTGFTLNTDHTIGGMAGFDIAGIVRIGYSFEFTTQVTGTINYGNHELLMALKIK